MAKRFYSYLPLVLILITASFLRFIFLDRIPGAVSGDELTYLLTARFIGLTGNDVNSSWNMFSVLFFNYPTSFPQAELPYFLAYLPVNLFGFSLFANRFLYAALSVASVFLIYLVAKTLFGSRIAAIAGLLAAVNPWLIYIGRTTYEMTPAIFFYLAGICILLKVKGAYILFSLPIFILAFYSYIGTKVSFIPIIMIVSAFAYFLNKKKYLKYYLSLNILAIVFVSIFAFITLNSSSNRTSEILTPFSSEVSKQVDVLRRDSLAPDFINSILENKFTVYARIVAAKTLNVLSPDYLFFSTDNFIGIFRHGLFYPLDAVFLFAGAAFMLFKKKPLFVFLAGLILAGALPEILYGARLDVFSPHLSLFLVFLIFPIAYGIGYVISFDKKKILSKILILVYIVLVINFSYLYFFQFPISGHFDFSSRILAKYIEINGDKNITVYARAPHEAFKKYIYYADVMVDNNSAQVIKDAINSGSFKSKNVHFLECGRIGEEIGEEEVSIYHTELCEIPESLRSYLAISKLSDSGEIFRIYNDETCNKYKLKKYVDGLTIKDFKLGAISPQEFCEAFILAP